MKLIGKIIKIYIRGNTPRSLRSIEIVNWSGKAFMGNRSHLKQLKEIPELSETGIYFLLNNNEDSGLTEIYIGETDTSSQRINQHVSKDWWDTFIVFISRDLTKAHVRYLENKLYNLAKESISSLKVMNEGVPTGSKLPESEACAMEEFSDNMIFTLESLGLGLFQPEQSNVEDISEEKLSPKVYPKNYEATQDMHFFISIPKEISTKNENGKMVVKNGTFILKSGSYIRKEIADSFVGSSYHELWKQVTNSNAVEQSINPKLLITTRDLEFKSPSAAAAIVRGRATNGRTDWKRISDNKSFFECENEEAA
jgi:Domain of unknown function (DUF4357)